MRCGRTPWETLQNSKKIVKEKIIDKNFKEVAYEEPNAVEGSNISEGHPMGDRGLPRNGATDVVIRENFQIKS